MSSGAFARIRAIFARIGIASGFNTADPLGKKPISSRLMTSPSRLTRMRTSCTRSWGASACSNSCLIALMRQRASTGFGVPEGGVITRGSDKAPAAFVADLAFENGIGSDCATGTRALLLLKIPNCSKAAWMAWAIIPTLRLSTCEEENSTTNRAKRSVTKSLYEISQRSWFTWPSAFFLRLIERARVVLLLQATRLFLHTLLFWRSWQGSREAWFQPSGD